MGRSQKLQAYSSLHCLHAAPITNRSGFDFISHPTIESVREGYFRKMNWTIVGEAPKDFLRIYQYGAANRSRTGKWPGYIAKVGQKWYPNESITEHLLTRLGQSLGLQIADSRLMWVRGQLRFLSRYFLKPDESLVHGAEIFSGYLSDKQFVEEVEAKKQSREVFTYQVVEDAIRTLFPDQEKEILEGFVRLLAFDAVVGNNDRHYYNWGVITQVNGERAPRLAPIYDTARALFWNFSEEKLAAVGPGNREDVFMEKYIEGCQPKTGWDDTPGINHFGLMRALANSQPSMKAVLEALPVDGLANAAHLLLSEEFDGLFSERRAIFVLSCLQERIKKFKNAITIC